MALTTIAAITAVAFTGRVVLMAWKKHVASRPTQVAVAQTVSKFNSASFYRGGFQVQMSKDEAAKILGVRLTSPRDKIIAAHRKVMTLNHPDAGGSTYLASKINEAKDMLLDEKKGQRGFQQE